MKYNLAIVCLLSFVLFSCAQKEDFKMNGVSFVAAPDSLQKQQILPIKEVNANYTAIMPFGFIRTLEHPELIFDTNRQWFGETSVGAEQYINLLQKEDIKIMIKPQIWIWRGEFTGNLKMKSEEDWKQLESSYRNFILTYARLAQKMQVPLFCIGIELEQFVMARPKYWSKLITEIKEEYSGKLTYAANWDEYKRVPFWEELDFIGIDAYFPISEEKTPKIETVKNGWQPWKEELKHFSEKFNKQILFTEYGYRSLDFAGREPWDSNHELTSINLEAQNNLLEGMYQEIWNESWFAGGFIWKWFINHDKVGGLKNNQFTPQNKPAQHIVKRAYKTK